MKTLHANRQRANLKIMDNVMSLIYAHPDLRFNQILMALNISIMSDNGEGLKDLFYEESDVTLKRVEQAINDFNKTN